MDVKRLWRTIRLNTCKNRNAYIRKAHIFAEFGKNSTMSSRKIPLYPELISIGNNVRLAANVSLVPHDMIHSMLNNLSTENILLKREMDTCCIYSIRKQMSIRININKG